MNEVEVITIHYSVFWFHGLPFTCTTHNLLLWQLQRRGVFDLFDADKDGWISKDDFSSCLRRNPLLIALFSSSFLERDSKRLGSSGVRMKTEIVCWMGIECRLEFGWRKTPDGIFDGSKGFFHPPMEMLPSRRASETSSPTPPCNSKMMAGHAALLIWVAFLLYFIIFYL